MTLPSWFNFIQYIEVRLKYEPHVGYKCTTLDACGLGTFRLVSTLFLCCINLACTSGSFLFINLRGKGIQSHDANTIFTYGYIAYKCNCIVSVCLSKLFLVKSYTPGSPPWSCLVDFPSVMITWSFSVRSLITYTNVCVITYCW